MIEVGVLSGFAKCGPLPGRQGRARDAARRDKLLKPRETTFRQNTPTRVVSERDEAEKANGERDGRKPEDKS